MKRLVVLTASALLVFGVTAFAQHEHAHQKDGVKQVSLTGEVIDLTCFMQHPANAVGLDHAKCAKACIHKGLPVAFLAEDSTIYLLMGSGHDPVAPMVVDRVGRISTITGTVIDHHGVKAIAVVSIAESGGDAKAPAKEHVMYTCSMHPDVRQAAPGDCPKCGMKLELEAEK